MGRENSLVQMYQGVNAWISQITKKNTLI